MKAEKPEGILENILTEMLKDELETLKDELKTVEKNAFAASRAAMEKEVREDLIIRCIFTTVMRTLLLLI